VTLAMLIIFEGLGLYGVSGVADLWLPAIFGSVRSGICRANPDSCHYYDHRFGYWLVYTK
jgi:hypothetical protein